jgi:hypothetical protein
MKVATHLALMPRLRMVDLYLHYLLCLHGKVLNHVSPEVTYPCKLAEPANEEDNFHTLTALQTTPGYPDNCP